MNIDNADERPAPDSWETVPLRSIVTKLVDGSHNPPPKQDSGKLMLSARNIENNQIVFDDFRYISEPDFKKEHARTRVAAGDVLLTIVGTIGRSAVVPDGADAFALQRSVAALTPSGVLPKFLMYQLQAPIAQRYFEVNARGTAQKGVYLKTLGQTPISVAPIDEQERIVAEIEKQFSRLDEAVGNLNRVKANLKRYKAAVLKAAVEGRLVETEAELARRERRTYETGEQALTRLLEARLHRWKGKGKYKEPVAPEANDLQGLPEGWAWATLDQLATVVRGASPRPAGDPKYFGGSIPWITVGPLTADEQPYLRSVPETVTEEGRERSRYIEPETLLLTNSGATLGVPKITLIGGCINDGVAALLDVEYPLKLYLLFFLRLQTEKLRRINQGAAQPNLNTTIIKALTIPLAPLAEQRRIVAELDRRLSLIRELEDLAAANVRRTSRMKQALLAQAFSGG